MEIENTKPKTIIIALAIILALSVVYICYLAYESKKYQKESIAFFDEKEALIVKLTQANNDIIKTEVVNSGLRTELELEREEIKELMIQVSQCDKKNSALNRLKVKINELEIRVRVLTLENEKLKQENKTLIYQRDSTATALIDCQKSNLELSNKAILYIDSKKSVENNSKISEANNSLSVIFLKASTYQLKSNGERSLTDKAKKTDLISINFTIAENKTVKPGKRTYYIQILDSNGQTIENKIIKSFDGPSIIYTIKLDVDYQNKNKYVIGDFQVKRLIGGSYSIKVFEENREVAETHFELKS